MTPALNRDELTGQLLNLTTRFASKYRGWSFMNNDDLIQETMLQLVPFINSYQGEDIALGAIVNGAMKRAMSELFRQYGYSTLSKREQYAVRRVLRTKECMANALGFEPSAEDVAEEMQVPAAICRRILKLAQHLHATSLDAPLDSDPDSSTLADLTADQRESVHPERKMMRVDLHTQMMRVLGTLEPLEETTIKLRYGFIGHEEFSQQETAEELKISLADERRTEIMAMRKLRHPSRSKYLKPFLY